MASGMLHILLADKKDHKLCSKAARMNKFPSKAMWLRAIINGHLDMAGLPRLTPMEPVYKGCTKKVCRRGHPLTPDNVKIKHFNGLDGRQSMRLCRICIRLRRRKYEHSKTARKNLLKLQGSGD